MHIGEMIKLKVDEKNLSNKDVIMALRCSKDKLTRLYNNPNVSTEMLLKCSLMLQYNFFEEFSNYYKQIENDKRKSS